MKKIISLLLATIFTFSIGTVAFAKEPAAKIGETEYTTLAEAITNVKDGETITLSNGTHIWNADWKIQNKSVYFEGSKDAIIDMANVATGLNTSASKIKFSGITLKFHETANYTGFQHDTELVYENCTIYGKQFLYAADVLFTGCVIENKKDYSVWTYAGQNVTFTDCIFNSGGKAILVYNEYMDSNFVANITLINCVFNDDDTLNTVKAAVETGIVINQNGTSNNTYRLVFNDCKVNGFALNDEGIPTGSTLYGNKNSMDTNSLTVSVDAVKDENGNYTSGTFNFDPSDNVDTDEYEVQNLDGIYTVVKKAPTAEKKPQPKPACDHKFDEDGICEECGVKVTTYVDGKPESSEKTETNPNTGAENAVTVAAAIAALSLVGAVLSKKR